MIDAPVSKTRNCGDLEGPAAPYHVEDPVVARRSHHRFDD